MGSLLTTATMKPEELVELMFEASKAQFGSEVKPDGSVWNEEEARGHHIPRGLSYFLNNAIESQKAAKKNSEFPTGIIKNSQYVSDIGIDYKKELMTIINSAIGTGKTRALVDTIRDVLTVTPDAQIQVVCHRVQLVRQWEHDLAEFGFIAYDNKEVMAGYAHPSAVKRYVTTYDSLDRFLAQLVIDAPVLTEDEVSQLKALKDSALSKTDKAALERFFIAKGMNKEDLTVEDILWYGKVGKNALRVHKLATTDKKLAWSLDYQDYGKLSDYDAKFAQKDKKTMDALVTAIAPAIEKGQFTKSDLCGFEVVMKSLGAEAIRRLGIKVDMIKPTVVANGILGLMGYEVQRKRVRVNNVLVSLVSFKESSKDTRTKELDYLYIVTPGEYKYLFNYSLVPQITFEATEDAEHLDSLNDA